MNQQEYERAIATAQGFSDAHLRKLLDAGPDGVQPDAWQVLIDERTRRERGGQQQADEAARLPWGTIGWGKSVELGMGIAVGFLLVSIVVGLIVGLIRLATS